MNERNEAFGQLEEDIFAKAIEIHSTEDRTGYLDKACGSDGRLRAQLDQWLAEFDQPDEMFVDPVAVMDERCVPESQPERIGEFAIIREIGRGGMGIVYEARQTSLNRRVALKVLAVGLSLSKAALVRFQREAKAAAKLHHTNIVPVHTTGIQDGIPYYAMELVEGPSLDRVLKQFRVDSSETQPSTSDEQHLGEEEAPEATNVAQANCPTGDATSSFGKGSAYFDNLARAMVDVADALDHAHKHGIIHRDIKPSNLLLSPEGRVVINDFGLARVLEEPGVTMTGELMGSPRYMSPEQISSEHGQLDHRTDVYSLGVTIYEFLALCPAFNGDDKGKVMHDVVHKEPKSARRIRSGVPIDLDTICRKAMEKSPAERYQSASSMADDLRRFVNRYQVSARRVGPLGKMARWCRRNRTVATLAVVIATALAGLVGSRLKREREFTAGLAVIDAHLNAKTPFAALCEINHIRNQFGRRRELQERYISIGESETISSDFTNGTLLVRPMNSPRSDWLELGSLTNSPLKVRLPGGSYLAKVTAPTKEDHLFQLRTWGDSEVRILAPTAKAMVRQFAVPPDSMRVPWRRMQPFPKLTAYSIDRYEVTNGEFYQFVHQGGYHDSRWWSDKLGEDVVTTFVDQTGEPGPRFWENGKYLQETEHQPVVGVSWYEAMAFAKWARKQLPTIYHWLAASEYSGDYSPADLLSRSNIGNRDAVARANRGGEAFLSVTSCGTFDMAGNVKEWCLNEERDSRRFAMGGSWQDELEALHDPFAILPLARQDDIGFRCSIHEKTDELASALPIQWRSFAAVKDTLPSIEECRHLFDYPKDTPWRTDTRDPVTIDGITYQVFQIDTANHEKDRMLIYVAYPPTKEFAPPHETVILGMNLKYDKKRGVPTGFESNSIATFLSRGRAVVIPVLFGIGDRYDRERFPPYCAPPDKVDAYGKTVINIVNDYSRTIDFVERFEEATGNPSLFDRDRLAYSGFAWGGCVGPIWLVADYLAHGGTWRVKAAILADASLVQCLQPPEVDQMTYVPHLRVPTIMLNCRLMARAPYDRAQKPMFDLLPLREGHEKVLKAFPQYTGGVPAGDFGPHANRWLDEHLSK